MLLALLAFVFVVNAFLPRLQFSTKIDNSVLSLFVGIFMSGCIHILFVKAPHLVYLEPAYVALAAAAFLVSQLYIFVPGAVRQAALCSRLDRGVPGTATMGEGYLYTAFVAGSQQAPASASMPRSVLL